MVSFFLRQRCNCDAELWMLTRNSRHHHPGEPASLRPHLSVVRRRLDVPVVAGFPLPGRDRRRNTPPADVFASKRYPLPGAASGNWWNHDPSIVRCSPWACLLPAAPLGPRISSWKNKRKSKFAQTVLFGDAMNQSAGRLFRRWGEDKISCLIMNLCVGFFRLLVVLNRV